MKSAEEFKKQRNKKYNDWIEFDEKVKGQWKLIESIVDKSFNSLGHSQKYIDISNVGDLYKENERKLISEPNYFKITKDNSFFSFLNNLSFLSSVPAQFKEEKTGTSTLCWIKYSAHATLIHCAMKELAILDVGQSLASKPSIDKAQSPTSPQLSMTISAIWYKFFPQE